ncbi:hypothetical protein D3C73_1319990 [compost metagenome]
MVRVIVVVVRHAHTRFFRLLVELHGHRFTAFNQGMEGIDSSGADADDGHFFHGDPFLKSSTMVGDID